jgi:integrase
MRRRRDKGTGSIRERGKDQWELKIELDKHPLTGRRERRFHSFRGSRKEANAELARLLTVAAEGNYVDPSKLTVSEFFDRWDRDWAATNVSPKTLERYQDLAKTQIRPRIGHMKLQKLKTVHLAELYSTLLREGRGTAEAPAGLAPRTVGHVHRLLHRALGHAVRWGLLATNPASSAEPPPVAAEEIEVLDQDQVKTVLERLRGRSMFRIVATALATGMRRGELCALRWKDVDFDAAKLQVERSLEETKAGLRFKSTKTRNGRRQIALPVYIVTELRAHWKKQQEQRLALGLGKDDPEALVFRHLDGSPLIPNSVTTEWKRNVRTLGLPKVKFHALRHTHASQLIASGMDVLSISRRLGHASPSITLNVYGHLFKLTDQRAADVFQAAYGSTFHE